MQRSLAAAEHPEGRSAQNAFGAGSLQILRAQPKPASRVHGAPKQQLATQLGGIAWHCVAKLMHGPLLGCTQRWEAKQLTPPQAPVPPEPPAPPFPAAAPS